jgi:hypothetical protein
MPGRCLVRKERREGRSAQAALPALGSVELPDGVGQKLKKPLGLAAVPWDGRKSPDAGRANLVESECAFCP